MLIIDSHTHAYSPDEWNYPPVQEARRPAAGIGSLQHLRETCQAYLDRQAKDLRKRIAFGTFE